MPPKKKAQPAKSFEATLWDAADELRGKMDSAQYKHVVLGLIFLKYVSDTFMVRHREPHVQATITLKTAYHRNPSHRWTTNDLTDIDAVSVAYTYCDAVFTDKAIRAALASSRELRQIPAFLPRTPVELADWLDELRTHPAPWFLLPTARAAASRS